MLASDDEINFLKQGDLTFTTSRALSSGSLTISSTIFPQETVDVDGKPVPENSPLHRRYFGPFRFTGVEFETIEEQTDGRSARAWSGFIRPLDRLTRRVCRLSTLGLLICHATPSRH